MSEKPENVPKAEQQPAAAPGDRDSRSRGGGVDPADEKDLWHGRESWKALYPPLIMAAVVVILAAIGARLIWTASWMPTLYTLAAGLVIAVLLVAWSAWRVFSHSYRITTQRLFIRRGVLSQTVDQTELLRVDDVKMKQTLLQRILNIGSVEVISSDRTDSHVLLENVDDPAKVTEHVRRHTRMLQRRTLFMEQL